MKTTTASQSYASLEGMRKPRVFDFLDFRVYLAEYLKWRKACQSDFSYAVWAQEAGFKSRSFIRLVMISQRYLTPAACEKILKTLNLTNGELAYFRLLVDFNQAEAHDIRESIWTKIQDLIPQQRRHIVGDYYNFFSSHCTPRLQVLLTLNDIEKTPANLAHLLDLKISQVKEMLKTLKSLGLAEELANQTWRATQNQFEAPDSIGNVALISFHKKSLQEAIAVLDSEDKNRSFKAAILALTPEEFDGLKNEIAKFSEKILKNNMNDEGQNRKLYQVNLNLIPVSQPLIHADQKSNKRVPEINHAAALGNHMEEV